MGQWGGDLIRDSRGEERAVSPQAPKPWHGQGPAEKTQGDILPFGERPTAGHQCHIHPSSAQDGDRLPAPAPARRVAIHLPQAMCAPATRTIISGRPAPAPVAPSAPQDGDSRSVEPAGLGPLLKSLCRPCCGEAPRRCAAGFEAATIVLSAGTPVHPHPSCTHRCQQGRRRSGVTPPPLPAKGR